MTERNTVSEVSAEELRRARREQQGREFQEQLKKEMGFPWFLLIMGGIGLLACAVAFYKMVEVLFK